jgi:spore coat protein U-like protein
MRKFISATLAAGVMTAGAAQAASPATTTFAVTATVQATCSASATALAFPAYTPGGGAVTQTSTVSVKCTKSSAYTVALNGGVGGTTAQRLMTSGTNTLQYQLYTSNTYGTVWGDGTNSSVTQAGTGSGVATANTLTVYGQLPDSAANQGAVPATTYADTITVTVAY